MIIVLITSFSALNFPKFNTSGRGRRAGGWGLVVENSGCRIRPGLTFQVIPPGRLTLTFRRLVTLPATPPSRPIKNRRG